MSELLDKLWPAFVSEIADHLDNLELLLANHQNASAIDIDELFRGFHTIKGNCAMVGFSSMETLAHLSEDILSAIRNDDQTLSESTIDILLESISALKKQFIHASETKKNPPEEVALGQRLSDFTKQTTTQPSTSDNQDWVGFAQATKLAIPSLILALDPNAKTQQVEIALSTLIQQSKDLNFNALLSSLNHFIKTLSSKNRSDNSALISLAAEIFDDIAHIANQHQVDLGLSVGAKLCRARLSKPYQDILLEMDKLLDDIRSVPEEEWQSEQFMHLVKLSNQLSELTTLQQFSVLSPIWRYSKQLVIDASRGHIVVNHAIIAELVSLIALTKDYREDTEYVTLCRNALADFQQSVALFNNERDELQLIKQDIIDKSLLSLDALADLKLDSLHSIQHALDNNQQAIEIDIDFSDETISENLLNAIQKLGQIAHSRTLFHDKINGVAQRTSFCFLLLTDKSIDDIQAILNVIDKGTDSYHILGNKALESANLVEKTDPHTDQFVKETRLSMGVLKVDGYQIDKLISDTAEILTLQNRQHYRLNDRQFKQHLTQLATLKDNPVINEAVTFFNQYQAALNQHSASLQTALSQLQAASLSLRVVPIANVFDRFHSLVRSTAKKLGKRVNLVVTGNDVKIDKAMIDGLSEPLSHIIRNSIDHGIEAPSERSIANKPDHGTITLHAEEKNDVVTIRVHDDGKGLDTEVIRRKSIDKGLIDDFTEDENIIHACIFEPGFSTSQDLSKTSGRGVGMDVVKTKVREFGGQIALSSKKHEGMTLELTLPISAAIQSVILIENNQQVMAIPERHTVEILSISAMDIQSVKNQSVIMLREQMVPIFYLTHLLAAIETDNPWEKNDYEVVIISHGRSLMGLIVDHVSGRSDILVKDGHQVLKQMSGILNAAVLDDGNVVIILDTEVLFHIAEQKTHNIITL